MHAVKQFVKEEFVAAGRRRVDHKVPNVRRPRGAAPLDRRVRQTDEQRTSPFRCGLAGGERLRAQVADHHRSAQRHAPQAAAVAIAKRLDLLEVRLGALLIDLCRRR